MKEVQITHYIARDGQDFTTASACRAHEFAKLADRKGALAEQVKAAEAEQKAIKAELLTKLAGAAAARLADGRLVTATRINKAAHQVKASSYVDVRVKAARRVS